MLEQRHLDPLAIPSGSRILDFDVIPGLWPFRAAQHDSCRCFLDRSAFGASSPQCRHRRRQTRAGRQKSRSARNSFSYMQAPQHSLGLSEPTRRRAKTVDNLYSPGLSACMGSILHKTILSTYSWVIAGRRASLLRLSFCLGRHPLTPLYGAFNRECPRMIGASHSHDHLGRWPW
jgi:hypothetical protein